MNVLCIISELSIYSFFKTSPRPDFVEYFTQTQYRVKSIHGFDMFVMARTKFDQGCIYFKCTNRKRYLVEKLHWRFWVQVCMNACFAFCACINLILLEVF